jgi:hypothetical protein
VDRNKSRTLDDQKPDLKPMRRVTSSTSVSSSAKGTPPPQNKIDYPALSGCYDKLPARANTVSPARPGDTIRYVLISFRAHSPIWSAGKTSNCTMLAACLLSSSKTRSEYVITMAGLRPLPSLPDARCNKRRVCPTKQYPIPNQNKTYGVLRRRAHSIKTHVTLRSASTEILL